MGLCARVIIVREHRNNALYKPPMGAINLSCLSLLQLNKQIGGSDAVACTLGWQIAVAVCQVALMADDYHTLQLNC